MVVYGEHSLIDSSFYGVFLSRLMLTTQIITDPNLVKILKFFFQRRQATTNVFVCMWTGSFSEI